MAGDGSLPSLGPELMALYEPRSVLGEGATGLVLEARQRSLDRLVALKLLAPTCTWGPSVRRRFEREARILASLSHPGIVAVLDFGFDGDVPFLVEERLEGETLERCLLRRRRLEPAGAAALGRELALTLGHLHAAGIVHRDLKPGNVFLVRDGGAKLLDFGLAVGDEQGTALTATGDVVGTPAYLAPELLGGAPATPASDLFALGALLFLAVTGRSPLEASSISEFFSVATRPRPRVASLAPTPVPPGVAETIDALLSCDPDLRPSSSRVAAALADPGKPLAAAPRRRPVPVVLTVLCSLGAVALVGALVGALRPGPAPSPPGGGPAFAAVPGNPVVTLERVGCTSAEALLATSGTAAPLVRVLGEGSPRVLLEARPARAGGATWRARLEPLPADASLRLLASVPGAGAPSPVRFRTLPVRPVQDARGGGSVRVAPRCPPLVHGGRLFAILDDFTVACLGLPALELRWHASAGPRVESLALDRELLYGMVTGGDAVAWSAADGTELWRHADLDAAAVSAFALPEGLLVRGKEQGYTLLDRLTGRPRWRVEGFQTASQVWGVACGAMLRPQGFFAVAANDLRTGAPRPKPLITLRRLLTVAPLDLDGEAAFPFFDGDIALGRLDAYPRVIARVGLRPRELASGPGRLFAYSVDHVESRGQICAIDLRTGEVLWSRAAAPNLPPLRLLPHRSRLYAWLGLDSLACLDPGTGAVLWQVAPGLASGRGLVPLADGVLGWTARGEACRLRDE